MKRTPIITLGVAISAFGAPLINGWWDWCSTGDGCRTRGRDDRSEEPGPAPAGIRQWTRQGAGSGPALAGVPGVPSGVRRHAEDAQSVQDDRLRAYIVWLPMFPCDSRGWAKTRSDEFSDKRVSYYWDGDSPPASMAESARHTEEAWDVYLLYGAGSQWDKEPPTPDFWMHQLSGMSSPRQDTLDDEAFEAR